MRFRAGKATFEEVVDDLVKMNPHVTRERLMRGLQGEVDPDDASRVKGNLRWNQEGIKALPESIGDLTIERSLHLHFNELATLPSSFGSLRIGKHFSVYLVGNPVVDSLVQGPNQVYDGLDLNLGEDDDY